MPLRSSGSGESQRFGPFWGHQLTKNVLRWTSFPSISVWAPMSQGIIMGWSLVWLFVSVAFIP